VRGKLLGETQTPGAKVVQSSSVQPLHSQHMDAGVARRLCGTVCWAAGRR
jgi:hypothetical protein